MTDSGKPDTTALAPASGKKPARFSRGQILRIVAVGLVAGACVGTVTGVSGMVERADKKVATERWGELAEPGKDPAERAYEGRHDTALSKLLLPASDYALGPDSGERGNDTEVDGAEAVAAVKETLRGLPQKLRRGMEKQLDRSGVEGAAMRTYARTDNDTFFAEMNISVVKDTQVIRDRYRRVTSLLRSLDVDKGPKVKGHRDAACFRFKGERKKDVQELYCTAAKGKHFVSMSAELPGDGSVKPPAELFAAQLDHLASPGEYV